MITMNLVTIRANITDVNGHGIGNQYGGVVSQVAKIYVQRLHKKSIWKFKGGIDCAKINILHALFNGLWGAWVFSTKKFML